MDLHFNAQIRQGKEKGQIENDRVCGAGSSCAILHMMKTAAFLTYIPKITNWRK